MKRSMIPECLKIILSIIFGAIGVLAVIFAFPTSVLAPIIALFFCAVSLLSVAITLKDRNAYGCGELIKLIVGTMLTGLFATVLLTFAGIGFIFSVIFAFLLGAAWMYSALTYINYVIAL